MISLQEVPVGNTMIPMKHFYLGILLVAGALALAGC
jgi:hypothetical protein